MYTLKAYDIGDVWGGTRLYTGDKIPHLISAATNFIAHNNDSKAAIIPTLLWVGALGLANLGGLLMFYDGPTPPPGVFAEFDAIEALQDPTKTQRYPQLLDTEGTSSAAMDRTAISVQTYPNMPHDKMVDFLTWEWQQMSTSLVPTVAPFGISIVTVALQAIPAQLQAASVATGGRNGSPLTMNPANGDKMWVEYDIQWKDPAGDEVCLQALEKATKDGLARHKEKYKCTLPTNYKSGDLRFAAYNPLFLNDAAPWQDVLASYGPENYRRLQSIHDDVDPSGFMTSRQKGHFFRD